MDICFHSVKELLGLQFYIPSYQRGYRWTEDEVLALLNDLSEYADSKKQAQNVSKFYCLQPLVIKKQDTRYEVIDGQQRLTTIFLILKALEQYAKDALGVEGYTLLFPNYATRTNCETYFETEAFKKFSDDNLDFLHISNAYETITHWFDSPRKKNDIFDVLSGESYNAQFIWYEIDEKENAYEVFRRLNSGKLSLTNSELVKAIILNEEDKEKGFNQEDIAREWENIENQLENDDLWYFINSDPEAIKYESTRMDFLLETILLRDSINLKDNYFIFSIFNEKIKKEGWKTVWEDIKAVYRTIQTWYNDRKLYHYVGFLINARGDSKESISDLLKNYEAKTKIDFFNYIKECCIKVIMEDKHKSDFSTLLYGKNNDKIHNILLLFNLATTQNQISETSRYPFKKHFEASKNLWSLEHIHAQNERKKNWTEEEIEQLRTDIYNIACLSEDNQKEDLKDFSNFINSENLKDEQLYRAMMGVFMGVPIKIERGSNKSIITAYSDFQKDDTLMNLALLQSDKNSSFNNKTFLEKRRILANYENAATETQFVPICTRNVFFKHYSPDATNPLIWDKKAGMDYVRAMMKVIGNFMGIKSFDDFDRPSSQAISFGLSRK